MIGGLPLGFAQPLILLGLISLPVLWWLLRLVPPRPRRIFFPPTRLLFDIHPKEETPRRTPWWLTLLRLTLATLVSHRGRHLGLAIRADPPARIQRASAAAARLLELAHAGRAPEEVRLDLASAVPARPVVQQRQQSCEQLDRPGWAAADVQVDRDHLLDGAHHGIAS